MNSFTMSVKDERRGREIYTTLCELSWEKLWEALRLYDGNSLCRDRKKFYIFSSKMKEVESSQV